MLGAATVTELRQDLVLVGGGHSHVLVLRMLAMKPLAGLRITLVSPASHTPYSGMLPGLIAGHYTFEQTHIDLARLCQWAGVRFIAATVTAVDPNHQTLALAGRPSIAYDVLSLDIGSQPELDSVPGARRYAVPVKPVSVCGSAGRPCTDAFRNWAPPSNTASVLSVAAQAVLRWPWRCRIGCRGSR